MARSWPLRRAVAALVAAASLALAGAAAATHAEPLRLQYHLDQATPFFDGKVLVRALRRDGVAGTAATAKVKPRKPRRP
jgi:hypothetical protein